MKKTKNDQQFSLITLENFRSLLIELQDEIFKKLSDQPLSSRQLESLRVEYFGSKGKATVIIRELKKLPPDQKKEAGLFVNNFKDAVNAAFAQHDTKPSKKADWFDTSLPGIRLPQGHLHIVSQAIMEITRIFEKLGFTRVRHPEIDWDWYAFESLNMPPNHPARDEWETFHIETKNLKLKTKNSKFSHIVLTPHTSNGQVREMEKGKLPIRMINIAKCYRRQVDISHTPMFHQFEGLYIDKHVSIAHLKGVFDFFVKHFYGPKREIRLRPFNFEFTEPSFEVDITCGICQGKGCRLCKEGWLEMAGAGMVHPQVLKHGGVDPEKYSGFAFGWGVERAYMMKSGTQIDDIRLIYGNDIRFLEQF